MLTGRFRNLLKAYRPWIFLSISLLSIAGIVAYRFWALKQLKWDLSQSREIARVPWSERQEGSSSVKSISAKGSQFELKLPQGIVLKDAADNITFTRWGNEVTSVHILMLKSTIEDANASAVAIASAAGIDREPIKTWYESAKRGTINDLRVGTFNGVTDIRLEIMKRVTPAVPLALLVKVAWKVDIPSSNSRPTTSPATSPWDHLLQRKH